MTKWLADSQVKFAPECLTSLSTSWQAGMICTPFSPFGYKKFVTQRGDVEYLGRFRLDALVIHFMSSLVLWPIRYGTVVYDLRLIYDTCILA